MRICVIDGQGGGFGSVLIKAIRRRWASGVDVIALGTNAVATAQMMKARANRGASGENAVCVSLRQADVIVGPLSIVLANSMMGELTPRIAEAVASSPALKILLPLTQEAVEVVGVESEPLPHLVDKAVEAIARRIG